MGRQEVKNLNIPAPKAGEERILFVGAGFAGVEFCNRMRSRAGYQVVLLDKNNYYQFQPLFYQVAMSGLEPASICFPTRKMYQKAENIFIRCAEVSAIELGAKTVVTDHGTIEYDHLVLGMGSDTNFFGNENLRRLTIPMKSISEAIFLRNQILSDLERSMLCSDFDARQSLIDIVIVGGGPTGVELAGALAEMKHYIIPKDYPELDPKEIDIHLVQSGGSLLAGMSENAQRDAKSMLDDLGVNVILNDRLVDYDGETVLLKSGRSLRAKKVIWAAGVACRRISGIPEESYRGGNRLAVDAFHAVRGCEDVYCLGDQAIMVQPNVEKGHPQLAQVAIQSARNLARNFHRARRNKDRRAFEYKDYGSMATIGRHKAVADLGRLQFSGFFAWLIWLVVHLRAIVGVRNKLLVLINWLVSYFTYDQSLRLIIRPFRRSS